MNASGRLKCYVIITLSLHVFQLKTGPFAEKKHQINSQLVFQLNLNEKKTNKQNKLKQKKKKQKFRELNFILFLFFGFIAKRF
jgi:hypothetical protein